MTYGLWKTVADDVLGGWGCRSVLWLGREGRRVNGRVPIFGIWKTLEVLRICGMADVNNRGLPLSDRFHL